MWKNTEFRMKHVCWSAVLIVIGIVMFLVFTYPRPFYKTYEGIRFRAGIENANMSEDVAITLDGKIVRNSLFGHTFVGKLTIGDLVIPEQGDTIEIEFEKHSGNQHGALKYSYYDKYENRIRMLNYGRMYVDDAMEKVVICVPEHFEGGGWNSGDGEVIAAPVRTREEAVGLSNQFLEGNGISNLIH